VRIFPLLMLCFLCVPIAEIYVLIEVGGVVGVGWTIALVVLTAVVGAAMMRAEGIATLSRIQGEMANGGLPAEGLIEGAMLLLAGALLLTPGFITDTVGFIALFRPTRLALARWFVARSVVRMGASQPFAGGQPFGAAQPFAGAGPFAGGPAPRGSHRGDPPAGNAARGTPPPAQSPRSPRGGTIEGEFTREDKGDN
jgi:UPF0716 protein FxsA